jgi:hypothetical protein
MKARRLLWLAALGGLAVGLPAVLRAPEPPAPAPAPAPASGFIAGRCRLLDHHARLLEGEARRAADEELAPIFDRMDGRIAAFAEWAFRWRTAYAMLRNSVAGGMTALAQGQPLADSLRRERETLVAEAFRATVVLDEDRAMAEAGLRWRTRLRRAIAEVERDHDTAISMYLGFAPGVGTAHPFTTLPPPPEAEAAESGATDLAASRMARPLLVRAGTRLGAAALPAAVVPDVVEAGALLPGGPLSVAALLGLDFVISRIDAWASQEAFAAEMHTALAGLRTATRDRWAEAGYREIALAMERRRDMLAAIGGRCSADR